ncbi:MAG TPA: flagellar hook-associated protein FlgL [Nevskia sp.]|nr:flagellar hook-associated protein FlgL [Nevskia sp.]
MIRIASSMLYQQTAQAIGSNQAQLVQLQSQMGSGLRIQTAADDPLAAGQALGVNQSLADVGQWQSNAKTLQTSLGLEDSALSAVSTALGQIQTLAVQSNSAALSDSDRQAIVTQMKQQLAVILQQANAQDASGNYLFGGTQGGAAPFALTAGGASYAGNSNVSLLALGPTSEIATGDPGDAVFMQLKSGDGRIDVAAAAGNSGSAGIGTAQVSDASQWDGGSYTLKFSGGQYQVLDSASTVVASGAYSSGQAIAFRGLSVTVNGAPADGDSFSIGPSTTRDLFATVQNLIAAVGAPAGSAAQRAQNQTALYAAQQALGGAQAHITNVLAGVGAREQAVNNAVTQLSARSSQLQTTLSGLQDLDYAQATTQLSRTNVVLQAAEQSYVQIQGLSLFNYLK